MVHNLFISSVFRRSSPFLLKEDSYAFSELLCSVYEFIWGFPLITLLVSLGIYFSWRLRFVQVRGLGAAFRCLRKDGPEHDLVGNISHFAALCTALSATLGTGNIVGIAVALKVGGPGALFWMILSSFFSLPLKYAEGTLAVKYRVLRADGTLAGGPMYTLERGLKVLFWLSCLPCLVQPSLLWE